MELTPRERELAAICHEPTDRIPTDAIAVENQPQIAAFLRIEEVEVLPRLGVDGRVVAAAYSGQLAKTQDGLIINEWGIPETPQWWHALPIRPLADAQTVADVESYAWPDPTAYDYATAARIAGEMSMYAVRGPYWKPLFWQVCDLVGYGEALMQLVTAPSLFEAILERVLNFTLDYCQRLLTACGDYLPIFCLGDDFATQRGLMISPEHWRRYLKPRYAKLLALGKDTGKFVWFHSCGDITSVLPDLIDIGMDVWETVQLHTLPMTASELKREYGRHIAFFGGINTQRLPFAQPDEIANEVEQVIEVLGEGGGYICGPDHHVKPDVPPENALALFDTARAFRRQGYTA